MIRINYINNKLTIKSIYYINYIYINYIMNPHANKFNEKIKTIKGSFFSALDDFKKYYVYYNKNPEVDEFQNFFANSKGQLQNLNSEIFLVTNNIQKKIHDLDTEMQMISHKLNDEKDVNGELLKLIQKIHNY